MGRPRSPCERDGIPMKIVLACGGSGGHIFPAVSAAEELKERHPKAEIIYFCGKKRIEESIFKTLGQERIVRLDRKPLTDFFRAWRVLAAEQPQLVVGFGGYASVPALAAAKCLGLKTLIHEQNVFPGRANRLLCRIADGVALSFEESRGYLPRFKNARVTGNPIRRMVESARRKEALDFFSFSGDKKTLLVLGGSQGAESINSLFLGGLPFLGKDFKERMQALHLCGKMSPTESEARCREAGFVCRAYSFFDRMDLAYSAADFSLGRAGATFLAEISARQIPAILVPYPHGDGHQRLNARVFSQTHEALVAEQSGLTPEKLAALLQSFLSKNRPADSREVSAETVDNQTSGARRALACFIEETLAGKTHEC